MFYQFANDIKAIRDILELSQDELAEKLDVLQATVSNNESEQTVPTQQFMEQVYSFAFQQSIQLNRLKEMMWAESFGNSYKLLFHGAKSSIEGTLSAHIGRTNNDFGQGFYAGENYEQAVSFVSGFEDSSVYFLKFDSSDLTCKQYEVNQEWMMTIAYYRGRLAKYEDHPAIQKLQLDSRYCDYVIAPIANNRMFQIIDSFIEGEITDEQCKHCLAATNLGLQYVFLTDKAIEHVELVERCYLAENEKRHYQNIRSDDAKLGSDKVKLARIQYRGKGKYIDEILA